MNQPLDSRQLRAFKALAERKSFTVAAKDLFLSQSAVSHSMKALEQEVGCRLFDRVGKKVFLTQAGEQLLIYADKILADMESARASLKHLGEWGSSRLRVGASTMACQYLLPEALREFKRSFPKCAITIEPGDTPELIDLLHENRIDVGIALEPRNETQIEFDPLFSDELAFLVDSKHPWAVEGRVPKDDLSKQSYILYSKSSYTYRLVEDHFRRESLELKSVIELGSMEAIKELTKLGLGVGVAAPWIARQEIAEGALSCFPIGRRKLRRSWGCFYLRGRSLNLAEETFITLCRNSSQELVKNKETGMAA
jgi:DNA-binding transcriptional LysR family regulator